MRALQLRKNRNLLNLRLLNRLRCYRNLKVQVLLQLLP
jgi:hypothetical protein